MKYLITIFTVLFAFYASAQSTFTVDFEPAGTGSEWNWIVTENATNPPLEFIANPHSGGINTSATVAKFTAKATGNPWALCFTDSNGEFTFDATNSTVKIMVFKTVISNVGIKFEGFSPAVEILIPNTLINQWEEITFNFSAQVGKTYNRLVVIPDFAARTEDHIILFDNIRLPEGVPPGQLPEPTTAPPIPSHAQTDVISVYSEAYTNLAGTDFVPNWGQSTIVTVDYLVAGNKTLRYQNLNYQGTQLVNTDVSAYEYIHVDFWTPYSTLLNFSLISTGPLEKPFLLPITEETWVSVDIPLSYFVPPVNLTDIFQFKVEGNGTVYFDNWYFWKSPGGPGTDATLSDLKVDGTTIPGFSPSMLNYTMELPEGTTQVPVVTAITNDPEASHIVNNATALPGTTEVVVTSSNGNVVKTYTVAFTVGGSTTVSEYCETEVFHFGNPAEVASAIYLTITNSGANSMFVEIASANEDPVDVLIVTGGSGATISEENFSVPGKISRTLTWASNPPANVIMNVLWSKVSSPGNWMLIEGEFTVPFEATCGGSTQKPYLAIDVQDNFENNGWGTIANWNIQDPDMLPLNITTDPQNVSNHVADYNRSGSFEWTNAQFILNHRMNLTERNTFDLKVYFPSSNNYTGLLLPKAAMKLQNSLLGPNAYTTPTEVGVTITQFDQWVNVTFDFGAVADSMNYDQVVVQFGGEGHLVPGQFYFDDLELNDVSANGNLSFYPGNGATGIDVWVSPTLNFTVPVTLANGNAITNSDIAGIVTFKETNASGANVLFNGTINATKTTITLDPVADLNYGQVYYVALNNEVIRYLDADLIAGQSITFTTAIAPKPYLALDVRDNFENDGWGTIDNWKFQDSPDLVDLTITSDPANPSNHVADYERSGTFEWTNAQFILDHRMDLNIRNTFDMKVYFPSSNNYTGLLLPKAAIKLQNSLLGPNAWTTQTEVLMTVTQFDQWVNLTFDFSAIADSVNYDQVVVQFGGEGHLVPAQFYFDNFELNGSSANGSLSFYPPNGATVVAVTVSLTLTFTLPVTLANGNAISNSDIASIVTFKETNAGGASVPFSGTINAGKTIITINPNADLDNGTVYYVALNDEVIRYLDADLIPAQSATFTTLVFVKPYLELSVRDNFENNGWGNINNWFFQDPDMMELPVITDPTNPSNHVADYDRSGAFEYANAQFVLDHRMDLTAKNLFRIRAYFPSSNNYTGALTPTLAIKLQNSVLGGNAWTTQTEIVKTVSVFDQWLTLYFEFTTAADSVNYDQVVVQFGGEGHLVPCQFYFDDIDLLIDVIGVPEIEVSQFELFPNPAQDFIGVSNFGLIETISIFTMTGSKVLSENQTDGIINISDLKPGIYLMVIMDENGQNHQRKFIKK